MSTVSQLRLGRTATDGGAARGHMPGCKRRKSLYLYPLTQEVVRLTQIALLTRNPDLGASYSFAVNLALATYFYRTVMVPAREVDGQIAEILSLWLKGRTKPTPADFAKFRSMIEASIAR